MKINRLETHDRYEHFTKQSFSIAECCQDLINQRPFGDHPFYIFAHARTDDDGVKKRFIWSPWIWKPRPQTNSMLFKVYPGTDVVKVIWMIPDRVLWDQYKKGNITDHNITRESIIIFENNREKLMNPEDDDPSAEMAQEIAFEYQPQLFKRESLPLEKQIAWDIKMSQKSKTNLMNGLYLNE